MNIRWFEGNRIILLLVYGLLFVGCGRPSKVDVAGVYKRSFRDMSETLILMSDGTHSQKIIDKEGNSWGTNGTWELKRNGLFIFNYYEMFSVETEAAIKPPMFYNLATCGWYSDRLVREHAPVWIKQESSTKTTPGGRKKSSDVVDGN